MQKLASLISEPQSFMPLYERAQRSIAAIREMGSEYFFFDDVVVFRELFFNFNLQLLSHSEARYFYFIGLKPDPIEYFFRLFKKFPAAIFSDENTEVDYFRALNEDPGGSPADAMIFNSERYILQPIGADWLIYGDRRAELSVLKVPNIMATAVKAKLPFKIREGASLDDFSLD